MKVVNNVVFDVGRVLIDFSYDDFFATLRNRGGQIDNEADFSEKVGLIPYEHGEISSSDFFERINSLLVDPLSVVELKNAWNNLFTPIDDMLTFAGELKVCCGVFLLSNTSELHWQYLQQTFNLNAICHDLLASYEVGVMKPDPEIFRAAERRFGLEPETTIFIDDKRENVEGALACGWQGMWHRDKIVSMATLQQIAL